MLMVDVTGEKRAEGKIGTGADAVLSASSHQAGQRILHTFFRARSGQHLLPSPNPHQVVPIASFALAVPPGSSRGTQ